MNPSPQPVVSSQRKNLPKISCDLFRFLLLEEVNESTRSNITMKATSSITAPLLKSFLLAGPMLPEPLSKTTLAGSPVFTTTLWGVVRLAGQGDGTKAAQALEKLCRTYWYPLYAYVRRRGHNPGRGAGFDARLLRAPLGKENSARGGPTERQIPLFPARLGEGFNNNNNTKVQTYETNKTNHTISQHGLVDDLGDHRLLRAERAGRCASIRVRQHDHHLLHAAR